MVSSGIGAIKRVRHLVPQATLHCNTVWRNCGKTLRNKLQIPENRRAHVLTFSDYDEDAGYLFELLRWKNLARPHEIEKATMVYKSLHGLAPEYLCSRFAIRETVHNLRDFENKLCIHYHGQIIINIALAMVARFYATNSHVMWGKQSPLFNIFCIVDI